MDKITRMLFLFSKLIQGEAVNKTVFCLETDCLPRSFDRDVEDVRLFLSESFTTQELCYDRIQNVYYLTGAYRTELEMIEYLFIERILLDTAILRKDELAVLASHLLSNTKNANRLIPYSEGYIQKYEEPLHNKALLKMHSDLLATIRNKSVIRMNYIKMDGTEVERTVVPCSVKYDLGYIYLIAFWEKTKVDYPAYFRLDRIYSFTILRSQLRDEQKRVLEFMQKHDQGITQMFGGEFTETIICCKTMFYPYVHDKFKNAEILTETEFEVTVKLKVFEDGFVKWLMSQSPDMIRVVSPQSTINKIETMAKKIMINYMEVQDIGKKN